MQTITCCGCGRDFCAPKRRRLCDLCALLRKAARGTASLSCAIAAPCKHCGVMLERLSNNKERVWCSDKCRLAARRLIEGRIPQIEAPPRYSKITTGICAVCTKPMVLHGMNQASIYCLSCKKSYGSDGCKKAAKGEHETTCNECGVLFSRMPNTGVHCCSESCRNKSRARSDRKKNAARRARIRGTRVEPIDPMQVFMRDGWKCKHCGCSSPAKHRGTIKPTAPELDHIVPLSVGGTHTHNNVQLLCRACNQYKGAGSLNDQLLLLG